MKLVFLDSSSELIQFCSFWSRAETRLIKEACSRGTAVCANTYPVVQEMQRVVLGYIHHPVIWSLQDPPDRMTSQITFSLLV